MRWVVLVAALVAVGVGLVLSWRASGPALRHPGVTGELMRRCDLDKNGVVDAAEYGRLALEDEPLEGYDPNADGVLDAAELEQAFLTASPTRLTQARAGRAGGPRKGR